MNNLSFPIFLQDDTAYKILVGMRNLIPEGTKVYFFGGTIRNAIYYLHFNEEMTQRDYDCIVIGDGETFANNLLTTGFIFGKKNTEKGKVIKKNRIAEPVHQFDDWVYLDCKIYPAGETIENVLESISDFTISAVALDVMQMDKTDWFEKIIALSHAITDIQNKEIKVIKSYPANIYKIIRFISRGYNKPSQEDIAKSMEKLQEIAEDKFIMNTEKTVQYLGSEQDVRTIASNIGITIDILNFEEIKNH